MKTPADHYIRITPYSSNTRDHRRYSVERKWGRPDDRVVEATWVCFGRNITYDLHERIPDGPTFHRDGETISTGCRTLAEVKEAAYQFFYHGDGCAPIIGNK